MISKTFNRYIWLLNVLLQQRRLTFEEISRRWEDSYLSDGRPFALRTFHMHRDAIAELFGVEIKCDTSTYEYYIYSPHELKTDKTRQWLLNSFTISNMIEAGHNMKDRILFEDTPAGTEYLQTIIESMQRGKILEIDYQPFNGHRSTYHVEPYAMKVYRQRWYIIGNFKEQGGIRNIALDRVLTLEMTEDIYKVPDEFDAEKYFANSVGIYVNSSLKPQTVTIRAYGLHVEYLRTLPLHYSQQEILTKHEKYSDFKYHLCLTPELTTELFAMGDKIEVLEPLDLREEIKNRLISSMKRYKLC